MLERVNNQAKACYERGLARNPNLHGKVRTTFEIGATGAVTWVRVDGSTLGEPVVVFTRQKSMS